MITRVETYKPYRDTGLLYRFFELVDENGAIWASGMEYMTAEELLELYHNDPEKAALDSRLNDILTEVGEAE